MKAGPTTDSLRDRFAAYIAHELRTPITLQLALAEAALADTHADALALRAMAEAVVASCEEQRRLIEALLDLTRSRQKPMRRGRVDLAAITRQALDAYELRELDSVVALERPPRSAIQPSSGDSPPT